MSDATTAAPARATTRRRVELDAIRTALVLGLVLFHSALVFDTHDDFYIKNDATAELTGLLAGPIIVWAMPLLFAIAGIAARHSLRRRTAGAFVRERLLRLGLPLLVITVLVTPIPQWIRALQTEPGLGYLEFLPRFFDVRVTWEAMPFVLAGEWFEYGHLWFVVLLLVWSLLLALLVRVVSAGARNRIAAALRRTVLRRPVALLAPAVLLALVVAWLPVEQGYAAWNRWAYLAFFLLGFALLGDDATRDAQRRIAPTAALVAVGVFAVGGATFVLGGETALFVEQTPVAILFRALYAITGWCSVLAIIGGLDGWAERRRRAGHAGASWGARILAVLGPLSMAIYVVHQPIVVAIAHVVVPLEIPAPAKFGVIVVASFAGVAALVEVLRRIPPARLALGLPWRGDRSGGGR